MTQPTSNASRHTNIEWLMAKISWVVILCPTLIIFLFQSKQNLYPEGIFRFLPEGLSLGWTAKLLIAVLVGVCGLTYIAEWKMKWTTAALTLFAFLIISFHEANGIYARATVLTMICAVQALAYWLPTATYEDKQKRALQFSVQMVVAGYVLAGIAKVYASGLGWALNTEGFYLQIFKNFYFLHADTGDSSYLDFAQNIGKVFERFPVVPVAMLTGALLLELFCFLVMYYPKLTLWWGIGLLLMHMGIAALMGIGISVIAFPMVIYFINPLYQLSRLFLKIQE